MGKNVYKISVWVWVTILFFVFSCGGEAEKERVRVEREKGLAKEDSIQKRKKIDSLNSLRKDPFYSPTITISDEDMKKILQNVKFDKEDSLPK